MDDKQLTPYDQLPPAIALNPYVREIYVRLKLVEDGKTSIANTPRKQKTKVDWKIIVIFFCLSASGYIYYNMFFATRSVGVDVPGVNPAEFQRLESEIAAVQEKIKTQTGPEKAESEKLLLSLQNQLAGIGGGLSPQLFMPPGLNGVPGTPKGEPAAPAH